VRNHRPRPPALPEGFSGDLEQALARIGKLLQGDKVLHVYRDYGNQVSASVPASLALA
jgi:hypothetical protein